MPTPAVKNLLSLVFSMSTALLLSGCNTDLQDDANKNKATTYKLSGTVSGLVGKLSLQTTGTEQLSITSDGVFTFPEAFAAGSNYQVFIVSQSANQACTVSNATGKLSADVSNVKVTCADSLTYSLGGTVSGLAGTVVLQNNGASSLTLTANGDFAFKGGFLEGSHYHITVASAPDAQQCTISNATGTLSADVANIGIECIGSLGDVTATPGFEEVTLTWSDVAGADSYHLYWATESGLTPDDYASYQDGTWLQNVTSPVTVAGLTNDQNHYFIVTAVNQSVESDPSGEVIGVPSLPPELNLNDTGINWCADRSTNGLDCPVTGYEGQDGESGRDVTHADDSDGRAGFSYTKLDQNGVELAASATDWECVKDNITGLVWEVKTTDGSLRDAGNTYTWYNTDDTVNGGSAGTANGGTCVGSDCDTESYVQAVNAAGLCGANDWRLPTAKELPSLADKGRTNPAIDTGYFPNTASSYYWSSSPSAGNSDYAWYVNFYGGNLFNGIYYKSGDRRVRLVRVGQ